MKWPQIFRRKNRNSVARQQRSFDAAKLGELLGDWAVTKKQIDDDIRAGGVALRSRARESVQNNNYARKYLNILKTNVVGDKGIRLQARSLNRNGKLDLAANDVVEAAWAEFSQAVDVTGKLSMVDAQTLFINQVPRDGEVLIREVVGFPNKWGYAIQFIDVGLLDERYNDTLKNGNRVKMGIEFDGWNRPVGYWLTQSAGGNGATYVAGVHRVRLDAAEIIHAFRPEHSTQSRGFTWMCAALVKMHHLTKFEEYAVIAARIGASAMGFFTEDYPDSYNGDGKDSSGDITMSAKPGSFRKLPRGVKFEKFESTYPSDMVEGFIKRSLKGISSGLNISYNSLASDPEGVSFGTIRSFTIEDRDNFRALQGWMSQVLLDRIYRRWLSQAMLTGAIKMPADRYEKLLRVRWQPRGWQWLDPLKDAAAFEKLLKNKLTAPSLIVGALGLDYDEVCQQIAADEETKKRHKIPIESEATK